MKEKITMDHDYIIDFDWSKDEGYDIFDVVDCNTMESIDISYSTRFEIECRLENIRAEYSTAQKISFFGV